MRNVWPAWPPFPQDLRAEHGFDNRGDHLSLSPLLMESFLKLGQSITQSPDFVQKNVEVWDQFFAAPAADTVLATEIRHRLESFLMQAFRRPVEQELLDRYAAFVSRQLDSGVAFTEAMKFVAAATIASPKFLYLYEKSGSEETAAALDDFELASRLSFFLWGSLPDQALLDLAAAGTLSTPEVLDTQLNRMLKASKTEAILRQLSVSVAAAGAHHFLRAESGEVSGLLLFQIPSQYAHDDGTAAAV